jgi:hypothetical protein
LFQFLPISVNLFPIVLAVVIAGVCDVFAVLTISINFFFSVLLAILSLMLVIPFVLFSFYHINHASVLRQLFLLCIVCYISPIVFQILLFLMWLFNLSPCFSSLSSFVLLYVSIPVVSYLLLLVISLHILSRI